VNSTKGGAVMPYEYLVVLYPRERRVKLNDDFMGQTNTTIEIERGEYDVTLGPPMNFTPEVQEVDLRNTSLLRPRVITFSPKQIDL
jgi:hypothetical protein